MRYISKAATRAGLLIIVAGFLSACSPAGSGPNRTQVLSGAVENGGNAHIIHVNNHVTRATAVATGYGFSNDFRNVGTLGADQIRAGDMLGLSIWENVDQGVLTSAGARSSALTQVQVDSDGYVFVPYAGRLLAAGKTPDQFRDLVTQRLGAQTPDPQVTVQRVAGDGATVSVMGRVGGQGVYPIERPTRTLSTMLARAGGVIVEPDVATVTVKRGADSGKIWLEDLYGSPDNDIVLQAGDLIVVDEDVRSFIALGAVGGQTRVPLGNKVISALEAVAMVGGLDSELADPAGVFILRNEPQAVAGRVLGKPITGSQRFVYLLDLTRPNGLFLARNFGIRDDDIVYVTNAAQWQRPLGALIGAASTISSLSD
ncbi:polysaccharide biosynthesis/export family protein [Paracoccus liaowanqingii]|uniref:polysaccharide biosynthesis/export family protein n=1 Tax=Paracoccus liaowanqingii TaxID=2560053 RepID=UPI001E49C7AB|nr:polysaccharide biosynthesis/export family protein [Paracoccus liaowanqingii]